MKRIFSFILLMTLLLSFNSCEAYTYATTQDDIYYETETDIIRTNVSFDIIVKYGNPYYMNGTLLYYLYKDIYYYPYYYNNYWYVRAYRRPFVHFNHRPYFRPHKYDYRFKPGNYGFGNGFGKQNMRNGNNYHQRYPQFPRNIQRNTQPNYNRGIPQNNQRNIQPNRNIPHNQRFGGKR